MLSFFHHHRHSCSTIPKREHSNKEANNRPQKRTVKDAPQDLGALSGSAIGGKEENPNMEQRKQRQKPRTEEFFSKQEKKPKKSKRNRVI
jgi:hypothetical protein